MSGYKRIEFRGNEVAGCAAIFVPEFVWRLVGATISYDAAIAEIKMKKSALLQAMAISKEIQENLMESLEKTDQK